VDQALGESARVTEAQAAATGSTKDKRRRTAQPETTGNPQKTARVFGTRVWAEQTKSANGNFFKYQRRLGRATHHTPTNILREHKNQHHTASGEFRPRNQANLMAPCGFGTRFKSTALMRARSPKPKGTKMKTTKKQRIHTGSHVDHGGVLRTDVRNSTITGQFFNKKNAKPGPVTITRFK
jgi:hypothetical protein